LAEERGCRSLILPRLFQSIIIASKNQLFPAFAMNWQIFERGYKPFCKILLFQY
jgi:hypothetical protein